jgi:hypothetical protein
VFGAPPEPSPDLGFGSGRILFGYNREGDVPLVGKVYAAHAAGANANGRRRARGYFFVAARSKHGGIDRGRTVIDARGSVLSGEIDSIRASILRWIRFAKRFFIREDEIVGVVAVGVDDGVGSPHALVGETRETRLDQHRVFSRVRPSSRLRGLVPRRPSASLRTNGPRLGSVSG